VPAGSVDRVPEPEPLPRGRVQATAGVAVTEQGRILLVKRADDGTWCLPGGRLEFGESAQDGAVREFAEETGHAVEVTGLLGVYSRPSEQTHQYPDGEVAQFVAVVFEGHLREVTRTLAGDTVEVSWFAADALPSNLMACDAPIIDDAFAARPRPVIA
jgi:ADP-ribose pyrophosphatase YjhB (NUDIX family)